MIAHYLFSNARKFNYPLVSYFKIILKTRKLN